MTRPDSPDPDAVDAAPAEPVDGADGASAAEPAKRRGGSFWKELPFLILIALVLALLIKTFLVQAFYIPSGSMENTLHVGDRVLVNKLIYRIRDIHRGEIVVFKGPESWQDSPEFTASTPSNPIARFFHDIGSALGVAAPSDKDFIKRVIGVGGDHVKCCDAQGRMTVNGVPLTETGYLYPGNAPSTQEFDITVPKGRLWVMGDHRANSADSRAHQNTDYGGTVSEDSVVGRAMVIAWPLGHWNSLKEPKTFASVSNSVSGTTAAPQLSHRVASDDFNGTIQLPSPAELPLVMGVVGLHRVWGRRRHRVRSWRGGCGGWRTVRTRRRGAPRQFRGRCRPGRGQRRDLRE